MRRPGQESTTSSQDATFISAAAWPSWVLGRSPTPSVARSLLKVRWSS
jgi:hypothetical protein